MLYFILFTSIYPLRSSLFRRTWTFLRKIDEKREDEKIIYPYVVNHQIHTGKICFTFIIINHLHVSLASAAFIRVLYKNIDKI